MAKGQQIERARRCVLQKPPYPATPAWTQSFRLAVQSPPTALSFPVADVTGKLPATQRQSNFLPLIQQEQE